uniref:Ubiquitin conjugation factor E4 core domain-containing protein n=1 Tax=Dunaliella tertiolecta TaxID=3047 RepID=A0A7S3VL76_DUNTE
MDPENSEEMELQLAIQLSLQGEGAGDTTAHGQSNPAEQAGQQQQQQQQEPSANSSGHAQLQSILAAALSAAAGSGGGPQQAQPQQQQQRPTTAASPASAPSTSAASARPLSAPPLRTAAPLPGWIDRTVKWWLASTSAPSDAEKPNPALQPQPIGVQSEPIVLKSSADVDTFLGHLGKAVGMAVVVRGTGGLAPGPGGGQQGPARRDALQLRASTSGSTTTITRADLSACLDAWRMRPSLMAGGRSQFRILYDAFSSLPWTDAQGDIGWACGVVAALLGRKAFEQLASDEDDLYYDKGQVTSELLQYLKGAAPNGPAMLPAYLEAIVGSVASEADARVVHKLVRDVMAEFHNLKKLGGSVLDLEPYVLMLDVFSSPPLMQRCMVSMLMSEVLAFSGGQQQGRPQTTKSTAKAFEAGTLLGALMQVSSLVDPGAALRKDVVSRAKDAFATLKGYPNKLGDVETVNSVLHSLASRLQDAGHLLLKRLLTCKDMPDGAPACKEVVLSWLCMAAELNMERTAMGERGISGSSSMAREMTAGCSDAMAVNLAAVTLRFARPFVAGFWSGSPKFADLMPKHLMPAYYATQPHRMQCLQSVSSLAGERGFSVANAVAQLRESPSTSSILPQMCSPVASAHGYAADTPGGPGSPSFIADCFFLAQKMLHVGIMPAVFRFKRLVEYWVRSSKPEAGQKEPKLYLLQHCTMAALMEPSLVEDAVQFCMLQIAWLNHLLRAPLGAGQSPAQQQQQPQDSRELIFSLIPDYVLADSLSWLSFVIRSGQAVFIASKDIGTLTSGLVALLNNTQCVRSTLLHDKIVSLLLSMLGPQLEVESRTIKGKLGATIMRPGEAALIAAVLNSNAAQSGDLVMSLMRAYCAADYVVGLDVDKDSFDKYNMRAHIDMILEELWNDDRCRACIVQLASAPHPSPEYSPHIFSEYVECLFNALIYLFKDSLGRLSDIAKVEAAKKDEAGWAARTSDDRKTQEAFLESTQGTARGYMRMAVASLGWINKLAEHPQVYALCTYTIGKNSEEDDMCSTIVRHKAEGAKHFW